MGKFKKINLILLIAAVISCSLSIKAYGADFNEVSGLNWMSIIDSDSLLSEITIPGTHDSGAQFGLLSFKVVCQKTTIQEQLYNGYRYFDIRLEKDGDKMKLVHGPIDCKSGPGIGTEKLYLDKVLNWYYDFLENNPKETIIITVKEEHGDAGEEFAKCFFQNYVGKNTDKWYLKNEIPKLQDVRGKIVLIYRESLDGIEGFDDTNSGMNFSNWPKQDGQETESESFPMKSIINGEKLVNINLQDRYKLDDEKKWNEAITSMLDEDLNKEEININFFSTSTGVGPKYTSKNINNNFLSYNMDNNKYYGILVVDNGDKEIAKKIYFANNNVLDKEAVPEESGEIKLDSVSRGLPWIIIIIAILILLVFIIFKTKKKRVYKKTSKTL